MDSPLHASVSSLMLILVLQDQRARGIDTPKVNKLGEIFFLLPSTRCSIYGNVSVCYKVDSFISNLSLYLSLIPLFLSSTSLSSGSDSTVN